MALPYDPAAAAAHLAAADPALGRVVALAGPLPLEVRPGEPYEALFRSILYQQLSGKAAATIHGRLLALLGDRAHDPEALLALPDEAIRGAGVSGPKMAGLRSLAAHTRDGTVPTRVVLDTLPDDEVVARLLHVRGVGRWTVEMLLLFTLGRPDVWPVDDLGVAKGYARVHGLAERPRPKALAALGDPYRPYRSAAAWYLWRATELPEGAL